MTHDREQLRREALAAIAAWEPAHRRVRAALREAIRQAKAARAPVPSAAHLLELLDEEDRHLERLSGLMDELPRLAA
ncbi:MAG: hypothetical protein AB1505_10920 [Candidatus Latescibacterota bacterium]